MAVPGAVREHYLREIGALIERYRRELGASGIDYQLLDTNRAARARAAVVSVDAGERALLMLSFLSPLFLAGAAAAAVPIVLHLLKREPEPRVKFAAVKLLKTRAGRAHRSGGICASCCCWRCGSRRWCCSRSRSRGRSSPAARPPASTGVTVVALDTSYSMSAPGRFERARQLAKEAIDNAPARRSRRRRDVRRRRGDRGAGRRRPRAGRRGDRSRRRRDSARRATARRSSAAAQLLGGRRGTIVVVTDLQESGWDAGDRAIVPERHDDRGRGRRRAAGEPGGHRPCACSPIASSRPCTTAARVRARRACISTIDDRRRRRRHGDASAPNQSADATFAGAPRGAVGGGPRRGSRRHPADNVRYAVLGGTQPAVGARRHRLRRSDARGVLRAARARGRNGRATPAFQVASVAAAQLSSWTDDRLAAHAAVSRAVDARPRAARPRAARRLRAGRRRPAHRRRRRTSTATSSPTCSAPASTLRIVTADAHAPGGARARAGRRAPSRVPRLRGQPGDARPGEVPAARRASAAAAARRSRGSRPATRR